MILAATGHRPDKLFKVMPYSDANAALLRKFAVERLIGVRYRIPELVDIEYIITGMAQGWDTAVAEAAIDLAIPFTAAIPCAGQSRMWPRAAQQKYEHILALADKVHMVTPGEYSAAKMHARDQWMVDQATHVLALYNNSAGGTGATVDYANLRMREVINVWPKWKQFISSGPSTATPSPSVTT